MGFSEVMHSPFSILAIIFIVLSIGATWVYPKYYTFSPLVLLSYGFAYMGGIVSFNSIYTVVVIVVCVILLQIDSKRFIHLFASMVLAIVGVFIMIHLIKGFYNIAVYKHLKLSTGTAFNLYISYDKALLATILLGTIVPKVLTKEGFRNVLLVSIPCIAVSSCIILFYMKYSNLIVFDPKFPFAFFPWVLVQLFFVAIPEEVFFRGFLQREITKNLPNKLAPALAILTVSLLFSAIHFIFIPKIAYVCMMFIASVLYGSIYHFSKSIETSMITHFFVNIIHFIFFSYPMIG